MQSSNFPLTRDLVLIGGGHAHALVLRRWGMRPMAGVRLTVINPDPVAPYTGMLPGHVAGHYPRPAMMIDLVRLARFAGARLILGRACGLDLAARQVQMDGRPPLAFDVASLDIGITSDLPDLPGFADHAVAAKPMGRFAARWEAFLQDLKARAGATARVVVIGAGVGGVELAMAMAQRLHSEGARDASVTVLDRAADAPGGLGAGARRGLLAQMQRLGVTLVTGAQVVRVDGRGVELTDGQHLAADFVLGAAGALPQGWLSQTGLDLTSGFVTVGPTLQSASDPRLFAVGDCAHMAHAPRPKAGVFAVRQAPVLFHNLRAALSGGAMRAYRPQADYLKLVSTGGRRALADKWGLRLEGAALWRWKDRIDRRFMARLDVPPLPPSPLPRAPLAQGLAEEITGRAPLCGGCGAKVGSAALANALAGLAPPGRVDVLTGPGDDAAVLRHGAGVQVITTDHLRALVEDPFVMARIAALHALGDVLAMGAAPQAVLAQIVLPRLSARLQARTLAEIMAAAQEVFGTAGADIVGGHSSMGAELSIGFTVTGLAARPLAKGGGRPGDALILTRAIGSGTILAADMARAHLPGGLLGEAVAGALRRMQRPGLAAARILTAEAHALTDVTGFGLAGHLLELMDASGTGAELEAAAVPLMPGALALAKAGHGSSLLEANRTLAGRAALPGGALGDLLADPQTAGGFLAAVPDARAAAILAELHIAGEDEAAVIGHLTDTPPDLRLV